MGKDNAFYVVTATQPDGEQYWEMFDAYYSQQIKEYASNFARGIFRPRGTPLNVRVYGPFDLSDGCFMQFTTGE